MHERAATFTVGFLFNQLGNGKGKNVGKSQQILGGFFMAQGSPETIPERYSVCLEDSVMDSDHPPFAGSPR